MAKQIKTKLTADTTDFERKMSRSKKSITNVSKALSIGLAAGAAVATAGIYALSRVMSEAVGLANVQEQAETKLAAVLKATGGAAGFNAEQLKKMAGEFQKVTTFGDEVTLSGMAILATFKQVRGEGFERATKAAMDMSSVMGTDLNSSILQIGKALNNPIKGLSMLTRVGVTFTDEQTNQIKALQKSGDMYGAQAIILKELETQFGGTAGALRTTFKGSVDAAGNALGDLQEQMGFAITKNEYFLDLVADTEDRFVTWTQYLVENRKEIHKYAEEVGITVVNALRTAATGGMELIEIFGNLSRSVAGFQAVNAGKLDLFKFALMDAEELKGWLEKDRAGFFELGKEIETLEKKYRAMYQAQSYLETSQIPEGAKQIARDKLKATEGQINALKLEEKVLQNLFTVTKEGYTDSWQTATGAVVESGEKQRKAIRQTGAAIQETTKEIEDGDIARITSFGQYTEVVQAKQSDLTDFFLLEHKKNVRSVEDSNEEIVTSYSDTTGDVGDSWDDLGKKIISGVEVTTDSVSSSFGDLMGGLIAHNEDWEDSWDSLWKNSVSIFASALSEMAIEAAASGIWDMAADLAADFLLTDNDVFVGDENSGKNKDWLGVAASAVGSFFGFAKGGLPNADGLSAYSNSIVSKPTIFPFASGGTFGLMGENGSEAILPLGRTSSGELGVQIADLYPSNNGFGDPEKTTKENTEKIEDSISITEDSISAVEDSISATEDSIGAIDAGIKAQGGFVEGMKEFGRSLVESSVKAVGVAFSAGVGSIGGPIGSLGAVAATKATVANIADEAGDFLFGEDDWGELSPKQQTGIDDALSEAFDDLDRQAADGGSAASGGSNADNEAAGSAGEFGSFASGGFHKGGWRMVGERGPELEFTPPSRIFSNTDSKGMMSGQSAQIDTLISASISMINSLKTLNKRIDKWDKIGMPAVRA